MQKIKNDFIGKRLKDVDIIWRHIFYNDIFSFSFVYFKSRIDDLPLIFRNISIRKVAKSYLKIK